MRERIRQLVSSARRATRKEAGKPAASVVLVKSAADECTLGCEAVRLARVAAAMHMDQAAKLRARIAAFDAAPAPASLAAAPVEISQ